MKKSEDLCEEITGSFKNWASIIADDCLSKVEKIEGEFDNAQYTPELVPLVINAMKLYPCWSGIMTTIFRYGEATVSSSRVESNFNQIKNRLFKTEHLPIRVDDFVHKLVNYYKGDNLLLQNAELLNKKSLNNNNNNNKTNEENANTEYTDIQDYDIHKETDIKGCEDIHMETDLEGFEGIHTEANIEDNEDIQTETDLEGCEGIHTETDIEDNEDLHTETADRDGNIENMQKETVIGDNEDMHAELEVVVNDENNISFCLPCKNGDFPTGIHRCVKCKKSVHLFGCSVRYIHSEEGYG